MKDSTANGATNTNNSVSHSFDPLGEKVNEKSYAGGGAGQAPVQDIAEPVFAPPKLDMNTAPSKEELSGSKKSGNNNSSTSSAASQPFNQEMNELSDPEKKKAAEQAALFAMSMYKGAHIWANANLVQISEKKINKLQMEGEIDLNIPVPYSHHGMVRLGEFITEYNGQAGEILVVEKEFEEAVMPPLTRVLAKRGAGMSDEQFLLFMLGQDVIKKGIMISQMKGQVKDILSFAREQTAAARMRPVVNAPVVAMHAVKEEPLVQEPVVRQPQGTTLQEQALNKVRVDGAGSEGTILPDLHGSPERVNSMQALMEKDASEQLKKHKTRQALQNGGIPKPRKKKPSVPVAPKKRGRKAGTTNNTVK
jgi:hypothetical protein